MGNIGASGVQGYSGMDWSRQFPFGTPAGGPPWYNNFVQQFQNYPNSLGDFSRLPAEMNPNNPNGIATTGTPSFGGPTQPNGRLPQQNNQGAPIYSPIGPQVGPGLQPVQNPVVSHLGPPIDPRLGFPGASAPQSGSKGMGGMNNYGNAPLRGY